MHRVLALTIILITLSPLLVAQHTTVSGQIKDSNGSIYANCTGSANFVGQSTTPGAGPYLLNGSVFQTSTPVYCDASGNITVSLADNSLISPSPSQWSFSFCSGSGYPGGPYCKSGILITITGASQTITSSVASQMPLLPVLNGGCLNAVCASLSANNNFTGTNSSVNAGTFTSAQHFYVSSQIGGTSAGAWWTATQGGGVEDAINGIATVPLGASTHQVDGVSGNVGVVGVSSPLGANNNGVGVYGSARNQGNNTAGWAFNGTCGDAVGYSGTLIMCNEMDFGMAAGSTPTRAQVYFATGGQLVGTMPPGPVMGTINVTSNSASIYGAAFPANSTTSFPVNFWSARGVAPIGAMFDAKTYTGDSDSQDVQYGANKSGVARIVTTKADTNGNFVVSSSVSSTGVEIPQSSFAQLTTQIAGVVLFCTDCTNTADNGHTAGASCAGSGNGAMAIRQNGAWRCY